MTPIVAIGVMRLDDWRQGRRFQAHAALALETAKQAEGCLFADAIQHGELYYSLSHWRDEAAMQAYVADDGHTRAMRGLLRYGTSLGFLKYEADEAPGWDEALTRFRTSQREVINRQHPAHGRL